MLKKVTEFGLFVVFLILEDFFFFYFKCQFGSEKSVYIIDFILKSSLIFLLINSLIYKQVFTFKSSTPTVILSLLLPLIVSLHLSDRLISIERLYLHVKWHYFNVTGNVWQTDETLGHRAVPNSKGYYQYVLDNIQGQIPVFFDKEGYRVTLDTTSTTSSSKKDLYLGCSFTFGDFVSAKKTYPHLTSSKLLHDYTNTGASAYGLAQMYSIAHELIPKRKYEYVFIQLSPWLVERAVSLTFPSSFGYWASPYFTKSEDTFQFEPPAFRSSISLGNEQAIKHTPPSYAQKTRYTIEKGFKVEVLDYYKYQYAKLKMWLGFQGSPFEIELDNLEYYVFESIIGLALANDATPVVLKLRYDQDERAGILHRLPDGILVIDLDAALDSVATAQQKAYDSLFATFYVDKGDTVYFDAHPNPLAHKLFATTIIKELNSAFHLNAEDSVSIIPKP